MYKFSKKNFFVILAVCFISLNMISFADGITKTIEVVFNKVNINVNGEPVVTDNLLYNGTTYAPIRAVSEILDKDVTWDEMTNTINIANKSSKNTNSPFIVNAFYANGSYEQFQDFSRDKSINYLDSISFGWSRLEYNSDSNTVAINLSANNSNSFYLPQDFDKSINTSKDNNISTHLNVFANENLDYILNDMDTSIDEIIKTVNSVESSGKSISFDGVTINFEGLRENERDLFTSFLKKLKSKLNTTNKMLYVTVPPKTWTNAYDYRNIGDIADYVILMAHDYEAKYLTADYSFNDIIYTPLTPVNEIKKALEDISNSQTGVKDLNKVILQLNFGTAQWKIQNGNIYDNDSIKGDGIIYPDAPTYEKIYSRIQLELDKGRKIDEIVHFDTDPNNPYLKYYNDEDKTENIIWYEDRRSIDEKVNLAKEYGLGGISIWRLGNIPHFYNFNDQDIYMNVWQDIIKNLQ